MRCVVLLLALAAVRPSGAARAQVVPGGADSSVMVRAVRFYSPGTGGTLVEGIAEVRPAALGGGSAPVRYRVEVAVADSSGMELNRSGWDREVPAAVARMAGASVMESFHFALAPGRYRVTVGVAPDSGPGVERQVEVVAFRERPLLSDLLLATAVREVASDSDVAPGEVRRGRWALHTAPVPHLTFTTASLTYYTEIYPWNGAGGEARLSLEVTTAEGRRVIAAAPQQLHVGPGGGVARGTLDLAGLPQGGYQLRAALTMDESTAVVAGPFTMGAPRAETPAAAGGAAAGTSSPFGGVGEVTLDSLYAPLIYLQREDERGVYENLTLEGKRRYLAEFWRRRDPTPGTPENPRMDDFYRGVRYANQTFREGGAGQIPGWRTDRGRVFLKYGQPNDVLRRPEAQPRAFEVWLYTRDRSLYYVFWDQTGFGHYVLLATNDRLETSADPAWESRLGADNAREILGFIQR